MVWMPAQAAAAPLPPHQRPGTGGRQAQLGPAALVEALDLLRQHPAVLAIEVHHQSPLAAAVLGQELPLLLPGREAAQNPLLLLLP